MMPRGTRTSRGGGPSRAWLLAAFVVCLVVRYGSRSLGFVSSSPASSASLRRPTALRGLQARVAMLAEKTEKQLEDLSNEEFAERSKERRENYMDPNDVGG